MKFLSYDGVTFSSLHVSAGVPVDLAGPDLSPVLIERWGTSPLFAGMGRGARTIVVEFIVDPGYAIESTLMNVLARINPYDETERVLAGQLNDGTTVYCYAAAGSFQYTDANTLVMQFYAAEPNWKRTARSYSPGPNATTFTSFTSDGSLAVTNAGQTQALPTVRVKWAGTQRTSQSANVGWKYRRTVTIENKSNRTLKNYPVRLDLDDISQWAIAATGTATGGTTTTLIDTSKSFTTDQYKNYTLLIYGGGSGTNAYLPVTITAVNASTKTISFTPALPNNVVSGHLYRIVEMQADGGDVRVIGNGVDLPRTLLNFCTAIVSGTTGNGSSTSQVVASVATGAVFTTAMATNSVELAITSGALKGETATITSISGASPSTTANVAPTFSAAPASGVSFKVLNCWCWTVLDELRPGAEITLSIVYGNLAAGAPTTLASAPYAPAFDLARSNNATWRYNTGNGPSGYGRGLWWVAPIGADLAATRWDVPGSWYRFQYVDNKDDYACAKAVRRTYNDATATWTTTAIGTNTLTVSGATWTPGALIGARIVVSGQTRYVTANTKTQLTVGSDFSPSLTSPKTFTISFNLGLFSAQRTWQDNAKFAEEGAYDGVALAHPLGIKKIAGTFRVTNPAAIAKFVVGSRTSGAENWAEEQTYTAAAFSETVDQNIDASWQSGAYPYQVMLALAPADGVEIPKSLAKDSGTVATAASGTISDPSKAGAWYTDQWRNGTVKIVAGKGRNQVRGITASTDTGQLTVGNNWTTIPDDTSRYIVTAAHKASARLTGEALTVTLNVVDAAGNAILDIGDVSATDTPIYDVGPATASGGYLTLRMGGGSGGNQYPHSTAIIGGPTKRLFLASGDLLEIDAAARSVTLVTAGGVRTSVPWAVTFARVYQTKGVTLTQSTVDWLPVRAGDSTLWVSQGLWGGAALLIEVDLEEAFIG